MLTGGSAGLIFIITLILLTFGTNKMESVLLILTLYFKRIGCPISTLESEILEVNSCPFTEKAETKHSKYMK